MANLLPEVEGWVKVAGAAVAILMAILVPVRSWLVEDRRFHAQTLEAIASASRHTLAGVNAPVSMLADSVALSALAEALNRVAAAVETLVEADEEQHRDRLTRALERFLAANGTAP